MKGFGFAADKTKPKNVKERSLCCDYNHKLHKPPPPTISKPLRINGRRNYLPGLAYTWDLLIDGCKKEILKKFLGAVACAGRQP